MSNLKQPPDRRSRTLLVIANVSLASGLMLWVFVHPAAQIEKNWLDAVCGLLMGLSIGINLLGLIRRGRCRNLAARGL